MDLPHSENSNKRKRKEMFSEQMKEILIYKQTFAKTTLKQDHLPGA
jgi:hypothetical protein